MKEYENIAGEIKSLMKRVIVPDKINPDSETFESYIKRTRLLSAIGSLQEAADLLEGKENDDPWIPDRETWLEMQKLRRRSRIVCYPLNIEDQTEWFIQSGIAKNMSDLLKVTRGPYASLGNWKTEDCLVWIVKYPYRIKDEDGYENVSEYLVRLQAPGGFSNYHYFGKEKFMGGDGYKLRAIELENEQCEMINRFIAEYDIQNPKFNE